MGDKNEQLKNIIDFMTNYKMTIGFMDSTGSFPDVYKKQVTGYAMVKISTSYRGKKQEYVESRPIFQGNQLESIEDSAVPIEDDEELVSVVPACKLTFGVFGVMPEHGVTLEQLESKNCDLGEPILLGFEYERVDHPDWIKELKQRWIDRVYQSSRSA